MKIVIFGSNSRVGFESVKRALNRNHLVTKISLSEIQILEKKDQNLVKKNFFNKENLKEYIDNTDAVIVAFESQKPSKSATFFSDFAKSLIDATTDLKRNVSFIFLTEFGIGNSWSFQSNLYFKFIFRLLFKNIYDDISKMEEIISNSNLNWIIVRPGHLKNKPLTEEYRIETQLYNGINIGSINRADVADFMIKQAENPTYKKQFPALSNK